MFSDRRLDLVPRASRVAASLTILAASTLGAVVPAAYASRVVVISATGISMVDTAGGRATKVADSGDWYSVAFSGDRLLATRGDGNDCELVDLTSGDVLTDTATIADRTPQHFRGLCQISSDSAGSLLFEASAGTAGSSTTYRLTLATLHVRKAIYGYDGSAAANGSVAAVQHRYFGAPNYGSYEQPWLRTRDGHLRPLARVQSQKQGLQYTGVALSRDGAVLTGTRYDPGSQTQQRLLTGKATGRLTRTLWVLPKRIFFGVQWASDRSAILVGVASSPSASSGTLYAVKPATGARRPIAAGVRAFVPAPAKAAARAAGTPHR